MDHKNNRASNVASVKPMFQTFVCTSNTMEEVDESQPRRQFSALYGHFDRTANHKTKEDFAEFVGYQLGVQQTIKPDLKAHLTSKNRVPKDATICTIPAIPKTSAKEPQYKENVISTREPSNGKTQIETKFTSQLYKMSLGFILN